MTSTTTISAPKSGVGEARIVELLGIDDWLLFGRRADGTIVYTVTEVWSDWLDAPHKGDAEFRSAADVEDWLYIAGVCARIAADLHWEPAATVDTDGTPLTVDVDRLWLHDRMPAVLPRCEYTTLTRFGTEQCDERVHDTASVDQWEREFCGAHVEQVRANEVADYGCDIDWSDR